MDSTRRPSTVSPSRAFQVFLAMVMRLYSALPPASRASPHRIPRTLIITGVPDLVLCSLARTSCCDPTQRANSGLAW